MAMAMSSAVGSGAQKDSVLRIALIDGVYENSAPGAPKVYYVIWVTLGLA